MMIVSGKQLKRSIKTINNAIDQPRFGVSFSLKQCRNFDIDPIKALDWLINEAGFKRFRLMSYWNEHEKTPGVYNFERLDKQIDQIEKAGGVVTLCLGARQPRWPENHWPQWAWEMGYQQRTLALFTYINAVVLHFKGRACIVSYQLENEALLENFGERPEVNRIRLRQEYALVKELDPARPIIMSTSTSWGIPLRQPVPDIVGFSYYQVLYNSQKQKYTTAFHNPLLHRTKARLIKFLWDKPAFIHELQLEPWGPANIWDLSREQQNDSMSPAQITKNLTLAKAVNRYPIDLWGGEWWYWRSQILKDPSSWQAVAAELDY